MKPSMPITRLTCLFCCVVGLTLSVGCDGSAPIDVPNQGQDERADMGDDAPRFTDITTASGIDVIHDVGPDRRYFFPEIMASGAAFIDHDQDGDLDIYLVNSGTLSTGKSATDSNESPTNRLFRQESDGRFVDVTKGSGLDDRGYGMGVAVGDTNNDGYPDIYVTNYGSDRLFLNRGNGTFEDITTSAGIANDRWSASACFVDFDRDGWLDLFVTNYVDYQPFTPCSNAHRALDYCNPAMFLGTADKLFRNVTGQTPQENSVADSKRVTKFEDVSVSSGIAEKAGAGLGVACSDFNGDGWVDLYVANDGSANFAWINRRDGTFRDEAVLLGIAYDGLGRAQGSMGVAVADVNDDSKMDLLVTNLDGENNSLYRSADAAGFQESSLSTGIADVSFPATGFGAAFVDVEHDGDLDLIVSNGRVRRAVQRFQPEVTQTTAAPHSFWEPYVETNHLLINDGQGRFRLANAAGSFNGKHQVSRALACGDIDNDGDIDLLVTNVAGPAQVFRNDAPKRGHWLSVRAVVLEWGGRDAYGALITIHAEGRRWTQLANPGSSYLSSHDPRLHFGLGSATRVDRIEVAWPDGSHEVFPGRDADQAVVLTRGQGAAP